MNKRKIATAIFALLIVLTVAFIFSNSLKSKEESAKDSELVAGVLGPMLEWIFGGKIENVGYITRKLAHFAEFSLLGIFTAGFVISLDAKRIWSFCGYALLSCLIIAVSDEFIQGFVDRGSAVGDVLIDFFGAVFGFFAVTGVVCLMFWKKNRKSIIQKREEVL